MLMNCMCHPMQALLKICEFAKVAKAALCMTANRASSRMIVLLLELGLCLCELGLCLCEFPI